MKKPSCECIKPIRKRAWVVGYSVVEKRKAYYYEGRDYYEEISGARKRFNFCPECGAPYKEEA